MLARAKYEAKNTRDAVQKDEGARKRKKYRAANVRIKISSDRIKLKGCKKSVQYFPRRWDFIFGDRGSYHRWVVNVQTSRQTKEQEEQKQMRSTFVLISSRSSFFSHYKFVLLLSLSRSFRVPERGICECPSALLHPPSTYPETSRASDCATQEISRLSTFHFSAIKVSESICCFSRHFLRALRPPRLYFAFRSCSFFFIFPPLQIPPTPSSFPSFSSRLLVYLIQLRFLLRSTWVQIVLHFCSNFWRIAITSGIVKVQRTFETRNCKAFKNILITKDWLRSRFNFSDRRSQTSVW